MKQDKVNAHPSKILFIDMLTRDISLDRALLDLVDNAVDGARRVKKSGSRPLEGMVIKLTISDKKVEIKDNCGGIPLDVAKNYAFRFGRPANAPATARSIGQFGVGMKRAFFKIANTFKVESVSENHRLIVGVDVSEWERSPDEWEFPLEYEEIESAKDARGTTVTLTQLKRDVADRLASDGFVSMLSDEIRLAHLEGMRDGLIFWLNGETIPAIVPKLKQSEAIKPCNYSTSIKRPWWDSESVKVTVKAGLGEKSDPDQAGWYVFCNGRLLLEADTTRITGWGASGRGGIPKYHNEYADFRGYVFFDSENPKLLPWNTTKTGVDVDSSLYQEVLITHMKPVHRDIIDWLQMRKKETEEEDGEQTLSQAAESAEAVSLENVKTKEKFSAPVAAVEGSRAPVRVRVSYVMPKKRADRALRIAPGKTINDIGLLAINYYIDNEG